MQGIAAWIVARPMHSVLALAGTVALVWLSFLSGVVLALLLLRKGPRRTVQDAALAAALLAGVSLLVGMPVQGALGNAATVWAPAALLTGILIRSRSLTLTMQLAWLLTVAGMVLFFALVADPVAFWRAQVEVFGEALRAQGQFEQADLIVSEAVVERMTMVSALVVFCTSSVATILGYRLYRMLPGTGAEFGRFRDFSYGRVLAFVTAASSVVAGLSGWMPVQNIAFVMFAMFWLQGLGIAHWSHGQGFLPTFGLAALYVLAPLLSVVMLVGLAITGYVDAWFGFRRRRTEK